MSIAPPPSRRRPRPARCRRFTLLDLMLAVGVFGIGCAGLRGTGSWFEQAGRATSWYGWQRVMREAAHWAAILGAHLVLLWRLRRPRPPLWRAARQWGTIACLAAVVDNLKGNLLHWIVRLTVPVRFVPFEGLANEVNSWLHPIGYAPWVVATCWLIAWLGRVGRSEPGWVDRAGRCLGWYWVASIPTGFVLDMYL